MKAHRQARVSEVIREVAAETILFELRDPRIRMVTVTRAEVSGDLQSAKVYVSIMGSEKDQRTCLYGLQRAAGFVQSRLADRMKTRFIPVITFVHDLGLKNALEVNRILSDEKHRDQESDEQMQAMEETDLTKTEEAEATDGTEVTEAAEEQLPTAAEDGNSESPTV